MDAPQKITQIIISTISHPPKEPHLLVLLLVVTDYLGGGHAHLHAVNYKLPGSLQSLTGEVLSEAGS